MEPINHQMSGGDAPCHLEIDATGHWLLVSNYGSGTLSILPILANGAIGEMTDLIVHHGSGLHPERQQSSHVHSTVFAPDQHFVIVADLGMDALLTYAFEPLAGRLRAHAHTSTRPGAGPRHMAFHPSGQYVYVANELDNTIAVYHYDAANALLRERQIVQTLPPTAPESTVADIHISPLGDRVYVSNRGHDSITIFEIAVDGQLAFLNNRPCGGRGPRNFAIAPNGRFLLVANQQSDEAVVLPVRYGAEVLGAPIVGVAIPKVSCMHFVKA
jgi:6-phosphogluconolactonase